MRLPNSVRTIREIARERLAECTESVSAQFLPAVRPIYRVTRDRPDQIGSCVLLDIQDSKYLLTAAHVIDEMEHSPLYVGGGELVELELERGRFWITEKPEKGRPADHRDFAMWEMPDDIVARLKPVGYVSAAKIVADNEMPTAQHNYVALGYPNSKNKKIDYSKKQVLPVVWKYSSMAKADPGLARMLGISGHDHLFLDFDRRRARDAGGQIVNSVGIRGASGGAVIDMGIIAKPENLIPGAPCEGRLAGILIEQPPTHKRIVAVKLGTVLRTTGTVFS